jgi:K+/H+ antiporter YhaU regulatory subunit KhtT
MAPARFVFLPGPNLVIKPSDVLVVIGREKDLMGIKDWKKPPASQET